MSIPPVDHVHLDEDITHILYEYDNHFERQEMESMYSELHNVITDDEIASAIKQLKSGKSGGNDLLINELFIHGVNVLLPSLTQLFDSILSSSYFPAKWAEGIIVPIHKGGDTNCEENYRDVTYLVFSVNYLQRY